MKESVKTQLVFWFTILYLAAFTINAFITKNYEFLYYSIFIAILLIAIIFVHKRTKISIEVLEGLALLGLIHILGGNLYIQGVRLYDFWIIKDLLKFDNLVHAYGSFVACIAGYALLAPFFNEKIHKQKIVLCIVLILLSMGVGSMNEVMELGAVVLFNVGDKVGNYLNNALDLVFNLLGSIIACILLLWRTSNVRERKQEKKKIE